MNGRFAIPVIWMPAVGSRLPKGVAVHFGMALQPDGWSSKSALAPSC